MYSSFYREEMDRLVEGAVESLIASGVHANSVTKHAAPGSFEVPLIGGALAAAKKVDALIGLGIIVEGETHHAKLLAESTTQGIMQVQLMHSIPFAFEILYVHDITQAQRRLDKGKEASVAVLHSLAKLQTIQS